MQASSGKGVEEIVTAVKGGGDRWPSLVTTRDLRELFQIKLIGLTKVEIGTLFNIYK